MCGGKPTIRIPTITTAPVRKVDLLVIHVRRAPQPAALPPHVPVPPAQANGGPLLLLALFMVLVWAAAAVVFISPAYVGIAVMALVKVLALQFVVHTRQKAKVRWLPSRVPVRFGVVGANWLSLQFTGRWVVEVWSMSVGSFLSTGSVVIVDAA